MKRAVECTFWWPHAGTQPQCRMDTLSMCQHTVVLFITLASGRRKVRTHCGTSSIRTQSCDVHNVGTRYQQRTNTELWRSQRRHLVPTAYEHTAASFTQTVSGSHYVRTHYPAVSFGTLKPRCTNNLLLLTTINTGICKTRTTIYQHIMLYWSQRW